MEPVSGPFLKLSTVQFGDIQRSCWRQKPPYDRPLPYNMVKFYGRRRDFYYNSWSGVRTESFSKESNFALSAQPSFYRLHAAASNSAYARLKGKVGSTAGWSENLAQIQKSRQMVSGRLLQLASIVLALNKRKFKDAVRLLRTVKPSGVSNRKAIAQNFLEFEYGIKPLVNDIQESLKFLTSDFPVTPVYIKGSAKEELRTLYTDHIPGHQYLSQGRETVIGVIRVACRTGYFVSNPNAFLANQLGFIDTALPWKLIPFSFVVDWFVNVEQVLSSMTDFYGVSLVHPSTTSYVEGNLDGLRRVRTWDSFGNYAISETHLQKSSVEMGRSMGLPQPVPIVRPFKGFSLTRGAQAAALVASVLGK